MNDDELVKELAKPIIEQLEKLAEKFDSSDMPQIPMIKFMIEPLEEPIYINDIEVTDELLHKLEEYLQDEIEMMHGPTILH